MECDAVARRRGPLIRFLQTAQGRECLRAWSLNSEFILRFQQNYAAYNALVSRFDKAYRDPRSQGAARERSVNTMPYAICLRRTGGPEVLSREKISVGDPDPGQVRLRQAAAGVNYIDIYH